MGVRGDEEGGHGSLELHLNLLLHLGSETSARQTHKTCKYWPSGEKKFKYPQRDRIFLLQPCRSDHLTVEKLQCRGVWVGRDVPLHVVVRQWSLRWEQFLPS